MTLAVVNHIRFEMRCIFPATLLDHESGRDGLGYVRLVHITTLLCS